LPERSCNGQYSGKADIKKPGEDGQVQLRDRFVHNNKESFMENNNGMGENHALPSGNRMFPGLSVVCLRHDSGYWKTESNINAPIVSSAHR
jgi:hypothetical protein